VVSIRKARLSEVPEIHALRTAAAKTLTERHGHGHWSRVTVINTLQRALSRDGTLYVIIDDGAVAGTFTLSSHRPEFYDRKWFAQPDAQAFYFRSMAIHPDKQNRGIGRAAMVEVEKLATARGWKALRFDAYGGPAGAGGFYTRCGYTKVHSGEFNGVPLEYFEKVLQP